MHHLLIKLMLLASLASLGLSYAEFFSCHPKACIRQLESRSRDILKIDWKPISVWPEEAKRFRPKQTTDR